MYRNGEMDDDAQPPTGHRMQHIMPGSPRENRAVARISLQLTVVNGLPSAGKRLHGPASIGAFRCWVPRGSSSGIQILRPQNSQINVVFPLETRAPRSITRARLSAVAHTHKHAHIHSSGWR